MTNAPGALTELRLRLLENGHTPLPAIGKQVLLPEWSTRSINATDVRAWEAAHRGWRNTGIRGPALDVDIKDPEAAEAVRQEVSDWFGDRGVLLRRVGKAPKFLVPFRVKAPFGVINQGFEAPNGEPHLIQFLCAGQQFIAAGDHPETAAPYSWCGGRDLTNTPYSELPEIDEVEARELVTYLSDLLVEKFGYKLNTGPKPNGRAAGGHSPGDFQATDGRLDVDALLAAMPPSGAGADEAQPRVLLALAQQGFHPGDIVEKVVAATMDMAARNRLGWDREIELRCVHSRFRHSLKVLHDEYDPSTGVIPSWLHGDFHEAWAAALLAGKRPQLARNGAGWYVRALSGPGSVSAPGAPTRPTNGENGGAKKYRFPLIAFNDMRPGDEQSYLVEELFPTVGLALVYGAPKSGKSFWVFDVMMHVTLNWEYRDRIVQCGPVVYCAFEGAHGYRKRTEAFRRHHGLTDERPPMFVVPGRADLIKDHHALIADMRAQLADNGITQPPKAVVLDTLNKSLIGSESKDIDMANYIAAAEAIQKAFGGLVIIVHHHGIEESRPRGHTSLRGAVDVQIKITRDEQNNIIAVIEDMRDGPEGAQIASRLVVVEVGQEVTGKPKTSAAVEPADATLARRPLDLTPNQRTMLSLLEEAGPKGLTADGWNAKARTAGLAKHRHATLVDLRAALRRKNLAVERDGVWLVMSDRTRDL